MFAGRVAEEPSLLFFKGLHQHHGAGKTIRGPWQGIRASSRTGIPADE
jgi:hypothetical protein